MNKKAIFISVGTVTMIAIFAFIFSSSKPKFVTVDTTALISKEAQHLATKYSKGKVSSEKLQHIAEKIKDKVALFAKENGVVILAKGAVWGGNIPDYTEQILGFINLDAEKSS